MAREMDFNTEMENETVEEATTNMEDIARVIKVKVEKPHVIQDLTDIIGRIEGVTVSESKIEGDMRNASMIEISMTKKGYDNALVPLVARMMGDYILERDFVPGYEITREEFDAVTDQIYIKSCRSKEEAHVYYRDALSKICIDNKFIPSEDIVQFERLTPSGKLAIDVIVLNVDDVLYKAIKSMTKGYKMATGVKRFKEEKLDQINNAIQQFGDATVRTAVSSGAELTANVATVAINALAEAGKSAAYTVSRDLRVAEIVTDEKAKSIVPNFINQWNTLKGNKNGRSGRAKIH